MSSASPPLELRGLTCRYGTTVAVDDLSLRVEPGEMLGLIGPDGAGKTTTLRTALGLLRPAAGEVRLFGLDPLEKHREVSRRVGYIAQRFALYGDLTVDENLAFVARLFGVPRWKERRRELLELVRLSPFRDRLADRLSGGMRQKLALAATLLHRPDLLILDEPTTGVDPVSRRELWRLLARLRRDGMTLVVTTPYLDEAERCQRVGLLHRGKLLSLDEPDRLRHTFDGSLVEVLARPRRRAAELLRGEDGVRGVELFGERLHLTLSPELEPAPAAQRLRGRLKEGGLEVETVRPLEPSLEDVFIARVRQALPGPEGQEVAP